MTPEDYLKPGVYKVPYHVYDAIPAVRAGYLHKLDDVPAKAKIEGEDEETQTLIFGRAAHTIVLERDLFEEQFVVAQSCEVKIKSKQSKRFGEPCNAPGIAFQDELWRCGKHTLKGRIDEVADKSVLITEDFENLCGIAASVKSHPTAKRMMQAGRPEVCIVWQDEETKIWCKALIDWLPEVQGVVLDLKTCRNANHHPFSRQVVNLGYDVAAAMRLEGLKQLFPTDDATMPFLFCWIAVEKEAPWHIEVYELDSGEYYDWAAGEFHRLLKIEKECRDSNQWPAWKDAGSGLLVKPGWLDAY